MPSGSIAYRLVVLPALLLAIFLAERIPSASAQGTIPVDVEIVIAVDVSVSMDREERRLQQVGFATAFRDPAIIAAIRAGATGRIAVTVMEWAGEVRQSVIVPWTVIDDETSAYAFADQLERRVPGRMSNGTAIGSALLKAASLFGTGSAIGARRVINISSDGINNRGPDPAATRDFLVARGITINALPIVYRGLLLGVVDDDTDDLPPSHLIGYFTRKVIGGPGAFLEAVSNVQDFELAIHRKLLREIEGQVDIAQRPSGPARRLRDQAAVAGSSSSAVAVAAVLIAATTWPMAARSSAEAPPR